MFHHALDDRNHGSVRNYLREAEKRKDGEMIRRWRRFVLDVLLPLDQTAQDLIVTNAHLISGDFPEEFSRFLEDFARFKFITECWKDRNGYPVTEDKFTEDDFSFERNALPCLYDNRLLEHLTSKYGQLRAKQRALSVDQSDDVDDRKISKFFINLFSGRHF